MDMLHIDAMQMADPPEKNEEYRSFQHRGGPA